MSARNIGRGSAGTTNGDGGSAGLAVAARQGLILLMVALLLAAGGCMYPDDYTPGGEASVREAVLTVQDAVDRYRERTGVLPIQNADASVPVYEKYRIDLAKLQRMNMLGTIPKAAFESGGVYQFLLVREETDPLVRLLDIVVYQAVDGVQQKVRAYMDAHGGRVPAGEERYAGGFRDIDFRSIGASDPEVRSMFSGQTLPLIVDAQGTVYVDYALDVAEAVRAGESPPRADEDLRERLVEQSYFVPVKSPVYRWVGDAPTPVAE